MITDAEGTVVSEFRDSMFGRKDFNNRNDLVDKLTECNYSYMQLIDFNARFYSPTLGRFIQPDIFIPNPGNSQSWNRYSYTGNNPIIFTDPSGHFRICNTEGSICSDDDPEPGIIFHVTPEEADQGVEWTEEEIETITTAVKMIGRKLTNEFSKYGINVTWGDAIYLALGTNLKFWRQLETCASQNNIPGAGCYGQYVGGGTIYVYSNAPASEVASDIRFPIHEIGHAFDSSTEHKGRNSVINKWASNPDFPRRGGSCLVETYGYFGTCYDWQQSSESTAGEEFADMFIGWLYDRWEIDPEGVLTTDGQARFDFMNQLMPRLIEGLLD
jgi:RHS repeat-associated protein